VQVSAARARTASSEELRARADNLALAEPGSAFGPAGGADLEAAGLRKLRQLREKLDSSTKLPADVEAWMNHNGQIQHKPTLLEAELHDATEGLCAALAGSMGSATP
jgi:hypothetical protein